MPSESRLRDSGFVDIYLGYDRAQKEYFEIKGLKGASAQLAPAPEELRFDISQLRDQALHFYEETKRTEFSLTYDERLYRITITFNIAGLPTFVFRQTSSKILTLSDIGLTSDLNKGLKDKKKSGLILVSGGMGSGKTTTAAAILSDRIALTGELSVAIEDPIETLLEGQHGSGRCIQLEVTENDGYPSATKKAFRMGATSFLLGEIRDSITANEVLKASLSMFVVSTIHGATAIDALERYCMLCEEINPNAKAIISKSVFMITYQTLSPVFKDEYLRGHNVELSGFNILDSSNKDTIQAKIAGGDFKSLTDQLGSMKYRFQD
ncbi:type IV secretion system protein [Buttiauxella sp. B2]|uniref:ATPase, T2SS/T4P/T4SS family n=1 Tax=Buttiauxella sp. B2 TaxID=2587812 RepID=UPI00112089D2|nr:ATPase, T2SS/T4P/T4SS family [Buttiauxella sp. B2]TNV16092.1 type IV secretion system protein [Buttiauxella sp. B2]